MKEKINIFITIQVINSHLKFTPKPVNSGGPQ